MKKILLGLLLLTQFAFSQVNTSTTKSGKYQMNTPDLGVKKDSAVVWDGTSKLLKYLPISEIKSITNLDYLATPTGGTVFSSSGNDASVPLATQANAGLFSPAEKTKLAGIASGATANSTDTALRDRSTHTGTQAISTIANLQPALDGKVDKVAGKGLSTEDYTTAEKTKLAGIASGATANSTDTALRDRSTHTGTQAIATVIGLQAAIDAKLNLSLVGANNGVAPLDAGGKVPFANLPASLMIYKSMWNATTNSPTLSDGSGVVGWVYKVSVAGTINLGSGSITFLVGDFLIHNGTKWERSPGTDAVVSVNGQQGVVDLNTSHIPDTTNKRYQTDAQKANNDATSSVQTQLNGKQPLLTNPVTGTGTTNYLAKFTGSGIGNSKILENGTNIELGINTRVLGALESNSLNTGEITSTKIEVKSYTNEFGSINFKSASQSSSSRKWLIANDYDTYGDLAFLTSSTQSGGPLLKRFSLLPNGNAEFSGEVSTSLLRVKKDTSLRLSPILTDSDNSVLFLSSSNKVINGTSRIEIVGSQYDSTPNEIIYRGDAHTWTKADAEVMMSFNKNGNLGINVENPSSAKLQVKSNSKSMPVAYLYSPNTIAGESRGLVVEAGTNESDYNVDFRNSSGVSLFKVLGNGNSEFKGNLKSSTIESSIAIDISSTNLNSLMRFGFFKGNELTNAPDNGYWYILAQPDGAGYQKQTATSFGLTNTYPYGTTFERVKVGGVWRLWEQIVTKSQLDTKISGSSDHFELASGIYSTLRIRGEGTGTGGSTGGAVIELRNKDTRFFEITGESLSNGNGTMFIRGLVNGVITERVKIDNTKMSVNSRFSMSDGVDPTDGVTKRQLDASGRPYKYYVALMSQSGTSAPTITVLENTIGAISWTRGSTGGYLGTLQDVFKEGKTFLIITNSKNNASAGGGTATINRTGLSNIEITTLSPSLVAIDSVLLDASVEIRVYP